MAKRRLTLSEMETIITFSEDDEPAEIFTYNQGWQSRMKELGIEPYRSNGSGGKWYSVPKRLIRKPIKPREYSPEAKAKFRAGLAIARARKVVPK